MRGTIAITLALLLTAATAQADPIPPRRGRYHPRVKVARKVFKEVGRLKKKGKLELTEKKLKVCQPGQDTVRRMWVGPGGKARLYQYEGGTDDRAIRATFYYDRAGRLVFALAEATYHNSASVVYRVYLNGKGKRVWQRRRVKGKPQGMYSSTWPEAAMIHAPRKALAAADPCKGKK